MARAAAGDQSTPNSDVLPFPLLAGGIPPAPPPALDGVLDAATVCLAARGPSRTTMTDIAREMGVATSTVYRKVGSVENATWLVAARAVHDLLSRIPELVGDVKGARIVTAFVAAAIRTAWEHPVFAKIIRDEPDFVGRVVTRQLSPLLDQFATQSAPFLTMAMEMGLIRRQDADALAHRLARITLSYIVAPPPGDLDAELDTVLLPLIES